MTPASPVEIRLTRSDLLSATWFNQMAGMFGRRALVIYAGVAILGFAIVFALGAGEPHRMLLSLAGGAGTVACLSVLILIVRYAVIPTTIRRQWWEQTELQRPHRASWTPDRLPMVGAGIRSVTIWSGYLKLYRSSRLYQVVPKRWLSTGQAGEMRTLLRQANVRKAPLVFD